ncbi:MAG: hypothetical protein L0227_01405 [Chloroflexi bacterium]|nr:hypothetical protein [Chloroflexota bacterium]
MSFKLRRRAAGAVSAALVALMLIGPTTVSAATPIVDVGSLTAQTNSSGASPAKVLIGQTVQFRTTLQNKDSSTISQLFLGVFSDATLYSSGTPVKYAATLTKNGAVVNGGCGPGSNGAQVSCSVRNVKPLDIVQATFVLVVPAIDANGDPYSGQTSCPIGDGIGYANVLSPDVTTLDGPATCVLSEWSSNGAPSSDGGSSHGDTWNFNDGVQISDDFENFSGRFVVDGSLIVANSQAIDHANPHSTLAYSPVTGIGVTVEDIDCTIEPVDPLCDGLAGFGQISRVNVNNDVDDSGITPTTLLHFYLQFDSSELEQGVNAGNISIEHVYPGGSETIDTSCTFAKKSVIPNNAPCIVAKNLPGGDLGVDVWTFHNGALRGNF